MKGIYLEMIERGATHCEFLKIFSNEIICVYSLDDVKHKPIPKTNRRYFKYNKNSERSVI